MEIHSAKAKPIEQEGRYLILLFGPDKLLKTAAAYMRARYRDYTVNIRSTDNPADSYAESTPCEIRVLIDSPFASRFAEMYSAAGLPMRLMSWDGEKLVDQAEPSVPQAVKVEAQLRLSNGTYVDRDIAISRAAAHMKMTVASVLALDEVTLMSLIDLAYGQPPTPEPIKVQEEAPVAAPVRKKKGKG